MMQTDLRLTLASSRMRDVIGTKAPTRVEYAVSQPEGVGY